MKKILLGLLALFLLLPALGGILDMYCWWWIGDICTNTDWTNNRGVFAALSGWSGALLMSFNFTYQ